MITIEVYPVNTNSDLTEGKGYAIPVGYFYRRDDAITVVSDPRWAKYSVMGVHSKNSTYDVGQLKTITIYDSAKEFWNEHDVEIKRQKALAKLTDEEKKLLGISNISGKAPYQG